MNKQNVLYLYNGVVFTCRREWSTNTGYNMNEPQKHYAEWKKLYAKGQISRSSSWKICKDTEYFGGCQGKGRIGKDFQVWGLFLDDENILELDSGDGCIALLEYIKNRWVAQFKMVNFVLCYIYLNKTNCKKKNHMGKGTLRVYSQKTWGKKCYRLCQLTKYYFLVFMFVKFVSLFKFMISYLKWNICFHT